MSRSPALADDLRAAAAGSFAAGRYADAEAGYRAAVQAAPGLAMAHHDLGVLLKAVGRLDAARASLETALSLAPGEPRTRHALGSVLLALGRYQEGWPLYDARHEVPELRIPKPQLPFPEWPGGDVRGRKLLLFPEQGFGDQMQYARFAPWLAARGADVTLLCRPQLHRLLDDSLDVRVIAAAGQVEFPDPDAWVMTGSLPGRCGLEPATLPSAPYLRAATRPAGGRIGVATRGNPGHSNDAHRSLPADVAAELLALPGAMSLEPEATGAKDFAETAAIVAGLDLVIAVDTAVAHLAGALGRPAWILLPRIFTDWRWMEGRADSPWYPTARLFRQASPGDWSAVLAEVRRTLTREAIVR